MSDTQPDTQLQQLARRFPVGFVEAVDGQSYVAHHIVNQRLLQVVGPFDFELVRELRSDLPEVPPDPTGRSARARRGSPALHNAITGGVWRLTVTIDGRQVRVEEVGDVDARNKDNDGARLKDASSDALKRCAMRLGLGLHLWAQEHYFLDTQLAADRARQAGEPGLADALAASAADTQAVQAGVRHTPVSTPAPETPQEAPGAPQEPGGDQDTDLGLQDGQEAGGSDLERIALHRTKVFFEQFPGGAEDPGEWETVLRDNREWLASHPDDLAEALEAMKLTDHEVDWLAGQTAEQAAAHLGGTVTVDDPPGWDDPQPPSGTDSQAATGAWEGDTGEVLTLQQIADATGSHFMHILNMVRKEVGHWATLSPGAAAHLDPDQLIEANDAVRRHLLAKRTEVTT